MYGTRHATPRPHPGTAPDTSTAPDAETGADTVPDAETGADTVPDAGPGPGSVIVVGSGPTGLLLAGDLAAAGIPVTVVEKRARRISNFSRAFVLHARTLEQFDARALADDLEAVGRPLDRMLLFGRLPVDLADLPSRFRHLLVLPQYEVEKVLERRAVAAGVKFRHETETTGVRQDPGQDAVAVEVRGPGGETETLRAAYVVGADGMRSTVRAAVGLPFPGRSAIRSVVLADVRLAEEPEAALSVNSVRDAFAFIAPFGDGYYRVLGWHRGRDVPDSEPLDLDEVKEITRLALGRDFGMYDARWLSRFHSDERQAPAYRVGRVFLAGDAAHVHTPAGGQGMNTGLQDAANLSWKLAAVLHGHAGPELLDTYQAERHPVGKSVLRSSGGIVRLAMTNHPWTPALRAVVTTVLGHVAPVRRRAAGRITGVGFRYPAPRGSHRLTGTRVPDVALAGGGRLYEALRGGRFVLINPQDGPDSAPDAARYPAPLPGAQASGAAAGRENRLVVAHWASGRRTTVLVRPDGYVAWAAEDADAARTGAALDAHVG
ncbi:FAD-dependent monooxygenase [Streptomyces sp. NPDC048187]|uniref:FAD-dependent monooxygenase n=1 Tax=Streptomyces sp. NPDC048187 TaxID=3365509 RepID=UPI00370FB5EA